MFHSFLAFCPWKVWAACVCSFPPHPGQCLAAGAPHGSLGSGDTAAEFVPWTRKPKRKHATQRDVSCLIEGHTDSITSLCTPLHQKESVGRVAPRGDGRTLVTVLFLHLESGRVALTCPQAEWPAGSLLKFFSVK